MVFIGLSLHHLRADGKEEFFRALRPNVTQSFILFEPIRRPGETRDGVLDRWWKSVERDWKDFTPAELVQVHEHVFNCDFPEGIDAYAGMARAAGFAKAETLFVDDDEFYAVIECRAK